MPRSSNSLLSLPAEAAESLRRLGARLRARRIVQGLTVEQAAERLLCSPTTYRGLENGRPSVSLGLLVHALWLFGVLEGIDQICPLDTGMIRSKRARRARAGEQGISDEERNF